ncbi:HDOD domain-containing protein [Lacimicrobium sp. SS2-24]|uniref:HDOD domain-containing protein n=1 Tax=Lacimicrobium sp. SS2-24 TaxID=2005569 RepID=UPI000B4AF6FB|nr:HDOD domain-containing protein [Lacimicrobium sp. SS2-24]
MPEQQDIRQKIEHRFTSLQVGVDMAKQVSVADTDSPDTFLPAVEESGRQLLWVEKQAKRDKTLNQKHHQSFLDSLLDKLNQELLVRLEEKLEDTELLYTKILGVHENLPDVLDVMAVRASSIGRVEPLVATIPWLHTDLVKMINMPKYRRTDKKGKVTPVDSLRVAMSFMGIENLKMVIPALAFRRWTPQITDPYPSIKTRLWEQSIGSALSCKKIAEICELDAGQAFTLGMLHDIGKIVLVRLYFRLFEEVQRDAIAEAHAEKLKDEHSALYELQPSGAFLRDVLIKHGLALSSRLIERMDLRRVFIGAAMHEVADNKPISAMSDMGKVLAQGSAYSKYRLLKTYRLINIDEAKAFLKLFRMPPGALAALKVTDLRHLNLSFEE